MRDPVALEGLLDRSINAFYEGEFAEGQLACDQLLCLPDLPLNVREITRTNQVHYAQQIQSLVPSYRATSISFPEGAGSALFNPTITTERADWLVLCTVIQANAPLDVTAGEITVAESAATDCIVTRMNTDLQVVASPARVFGGRAVSSPSGSASGRYGSCHVARVGERWVAVCAYPAVDAETSEQLALIEFVPSGPSFRYEHPLFVMDGDAANNWLPADILDELYLVDLHGSTTALALDPPTASVTLAAFNDAPYVMNNLRGVSQWVKVDDGFIALAADEVTWDDGAQSRLYRVIRCDRSFRITHLSHPFCVGGVVAEVGGLSILDGVAAFTFVTEGRTLHIATVDVAEFMALLKPVAVISPTGAFAFPMPAGLLGLLARWAPASGPALDVECPNELPVLRPETIIERVQLERATFTSEPLPTTGSQILQGEPTDGYAEGSETYGEEFYAFLDETSQTSARVVVPFVTHMVRPQSVVDLGCGTGAWLAAFRENGVDDVFGIDGSWAPRRRLQIPQERFAPHDLCHPLHLGRRFDLAVSLETAEHLAPECATTLVASLVGLAPVVLFSAAVPGQGGTDHRNLQWPRYWSELFAEYGFVTIDAIRPLICRRRDVAHWYVQNTFLFVDRLHAARDEILRAQYAAFGGPPFPWIHQDYWGGDADSLAREIRHVRGALFTPPALELPQPNWAQPVSIVSEPNSATR